tara:strand:+ start:2191 stop:3096 length:906 start_codon:yes stop_codon:yes gene_type:complete
MEINMNILIAGGSGFVGSHLGPYLKSRGYRVVLLTRQNGLLPDGYDEVVTWEQMDKISAKDYSVVINLCGFDISKKSWSKKVKEKIINSRLDSTKKLIKFIGKNKTLLLNTSAIGFYPFSDDPQNEDFHINHDASNVHFCQSITKDLEIVVNESTLLNKIIMRFGVVLGNKGMLAKILPTAKIGLGAQVGTGEQYLSWIHITDLCCAVEHLICHQNFNGNVVNITSPFACTQKYFINVLCRLLKKPRWMILPKWLVKTIFGQMGDELLLSSHNIKPKKLLESGFIFKYPKIELALENLLKE